MGYILSDLRKGNYQQALQQLKECYAIYKRGVMHNRNEYRLWKTQYSGYLARTYFSLGPITIQEYIEGTPISLREWVSLIEKLPPPALTDLRRSSVCHSLESHNILKTDSGFRMIDYGESDEKALILESFLSTWNQELEQIFSDTNTSS